MRFPHAALWAFLLLLGALPLAAQPLPADLALVTINPGQNLPGVVGVRHAGDGSDRLFAIVRTGQIRIFDDERALLATPFLNLQANAPPLGFTVVGATGGDERGLLGLAFHPLYAVNGRFYVYYLDAASNTVVTEYTVSAGDANVADPASARVILRVFQPFTNHNGGDIHFGADGYLYVGLGDGGSGNDPCESGQSLTSGAMSNSASCIADTAFTATPPAGVPQGQATSRALLGKMLRIDVDSTDTPAGADLCGADPANRRYGIPADNPFAGDAGGNAAACDEIYHYGLRNPYRFSFDRDTHDLIIGDVGQGTFEEVDLVPPGGGVNFGWKVCEGFNQRGSTSIDCPLAGATDPILTYGRDLGVSITGGFRYRGPYTALQGVYFYADAYFSTVFYARESAGSWTGATWLNNQGTVVGFGEDEAGHLYLTTLAGQVKRFTLPQGLTVTTTLTIISDDRNVGKADVGESLVFSTEVKNNTGESVDGLVVESAFTGDTTQLLECSPTTLSAGETAICKNSFHLVTQQQFDVGTTLTNVVTATAQTNSNQTASGTDQASVEMAGELFYFSIRYSTDLNDTNGNGEPDAGELITLPLTFHNSGTVSISQLFLTTSTGGVAFCEPDLLAPEQYADCGNIVVALTQQQVDLGEELVEVFDFSAVSARGTSLDRSFEWHLPPPVPAPRLLVTIESQLTKDVDADGLVDLGDLVRYTYSVTNTGNVTLNDVVTDTALHGTENCTPETLAPAAMSICGPVDHLVTAGDIVGNTLTQTAIAYANPPGNAPQAVSEGAASVLQADLNLTTLIFADGFEALDSKFVE